MEERGVNEEARGYQILLFRGERYLLIGQDDGPLATPEAYEAGACSYAHLYPDGRVLRFGEQLGTRADVTFTGTYYTPQPSAQAMGNVLFGRGWPDGGLFDLFGSFDDDDYPDDDE